MGNPESSQRRIDANRRNARLSTGPRTPEGKAASRRNSLIHGLAGNGVVVPEAEAQAARERAEQWNSSLRPMNAFEMGLVETIAVESVRIDRCRIEERLVRDVRARKAGACWIDDRKAEVAMLGHTLGSLPESISPRLSGTAAGCDWLMARWRMLGKALEKRGGWTAELKTLALDLMGVAADLREYDSPLEAPDGEFVDEAAHLRDVVEYQLECLAMRQEEALDAIDDDLREATAMGLIAVDDPTLVLLRRYETASFRRQKWALDMLHRGRQKSTPIPIQTGDDYRERPRQPLYDREASAPIPDPTRSGPAPLPDPEAPTPGPDPGTDRPRPQRIDPRLTADPRHPAPRARPAERSQGAAGPGDLAGRTFLAGRLRRLARALVHRIPARRTASFAPTAASRPACRLSRRSGASNLSPRAWMPRLMAEPAA
jgi:hypothetical protein